MDVYAIADNIFSPLGLTTFENYINLEGNRTSIKPYISPCIKDDLLYASTFEPEVTDEHFSTIKVNPFVYTKLEMMIIASILDALSLTDVKADDPKTLFIFSTTKGNINLLNNETHTDIPKERVFLHELAKIVCTFFKCKNDPVIISNACISGISAIIMAQRLLRGGHYKHIIVTGGDVVSEFTITGFYSLQALSPFPCRPFDVTRQGITLGEGCGTLILSSDRPENPDEPCIKIGAGATSNDANHITGPSRNAEGLVQVIDTVMTQLKLEHEDIDYISAHGTGTVYNDEMEAKAIKATELNDVPVNSLKGYFGHTLGAAGIIETIVSIGSLKNNRLFKSLGYEKHGVEEPISIIEENKSIPIHRCLKVASGFGGCNAALILTKDERG